MNPPFLFPSYFKYIGYLLAVPGFIFGYLYEFRHFTFAFLQYGGNTIIRGSNNYTDEYIITFITLGLFFVGFSKFKFENEKTLQCRSIALYWSVINVSLIIILACIIANFCELIEKTSAAKPPEILDGLAYLVLYSFLVYPIAFLGSLYFLVFFSNRTQLSYIPPLKHKYFYMLGVLIFITSAIGRVIYAATPIENADYLTCIYFIAISGMLILVASQEKSETDDVNAIRSSSMQLAMSFTLAFFVIITWLVYGFDFIGYMCYFPLFILIPYTIIFQYKKHSLSKKGKADVSIS